MDTELEQLLRENSALQYRIHDVGLNTCTAEVRRILFDRYFEHLSGVIRYLLPCGTPNFNALYERDFWWVMDAVKVLRVATTDRHLGTSKSARMADRYIMSLLFTLYSDLIAGKPVFIVYPDIRGIDKVVGFKKYEKTSKGWVGKGYIKSL